MLKTFYIQFKSASNFLILLAVLFISLVYLQNKNTMIMTLEGTGKLYPELFFSKQAHIYTQEDSRKPYKVEGNQYYFNLPSVSDMPYLRFDPSRNKQTITIENIRIESIYAFSSTISNYVLSAFNPISQIKDFSHTDTGISFTNIGNDPQIESRYTIKTLSSTAKLHIDTFLIALLIALVILFLYRLYQSKAFDNYLTAKLMLYGLFLALAIFKVDYYKEKVNFGFPPDEVMHLSYVDHVHTHNNVIPKFEKMMRFNSDTSYNYLNHPPLYYHILNLVYDDNYSIRHNVNNFRAMSAILFIASFLLLLYIGFSAKVGLLGHFVYLSFISAVPMYAYLGGSINNDTLAILGALIFVVAIKRMLENNYSYSTYWILGLGIFVAYFAKLTAAILLFFAVILFFIYTFLSKNYVQINAKKIGILTLFLIPVLYYQGYILVTYHSLMPSFNITNYEAYLKSGFYIPEAHRTYLSPMQWFERMVHYIEGGWFGIHAHHSFGKSSYWGYIALLFLHLLAILALFLKCDEENKSHCILGKIAMVSLFLVMLIQYKFSYADHINNGYMGGLQPRYLLPFMFGFAIMSSIFIARYKQNFLITIILILVSIHAIYSDFFYFVKYYS